jgi:hypothetical protein
MTRPSPTRIVTAVVLLIGTALALTAPASNAAPNKKMFTVGLAVSKDGDTVSAASLLADTGYTFVFTVKNTSQSPQTFGSAKILVPSGYDATPVAATSVKGFTASSPTSNVILVTSPTGSGIAPKGQVAVTVAVTTPTSSCNAEWTTFVKQSNDFLGTGNDFMLSGSQQATTVGTNHLQWTTQPVPTEVNVLMSPAPVVTALDPCGHPVTTPVDVTLTDAFDPTNLSGTALTDVATSATNGQASFANLTFGSFGFYDQLTAAASGFTSNTSDVFIVAEKLTPCDTTDSCSLDLGNKSSTLAGVTTGIGTPGQYVSGSRIAGTSGSSPFPACTAQEGGSVQVSDTIMVDSPRAKTVTLTIAKALVNAVSNNGTPFMDICLDIPSQAQTADNAFLTKADVANSGTTATSYQGLLPDCTNVSNAPPCVISRKKNAANEVITFSLPAGDPHVGAY